MGVSGSIHDFTYCPAETINYVTVHDNLNLWDKVLTTEGLAQEAGLLNSGGGSFGHPLDYEGMKTADPYKSVNKRNIFTSDVVRRTILANGIVLTSQGIPLFQAGDELLRSKFGDHNSYRSGDLINAIRWDNKRRFRQVFDYYKGLIALRKSHPAFRLQIREQVEAHVEVLQCSGNVVSYMLKNHANGDTWRNIIVIYNGNTEAVEVEVPLSLTGWNVAVNEHVAGTDSLEIVYGDMLTIPKLSMMVLYEEKDAKPYSTRNIEIHYERPKGDYEGWNLWVWGKGMREHQVNFEGIKNGRAVAVISALPGARQIGYIIRLNDWEKKDVERDRYIDLGTGKGDLQIIVKSDVKQWRRTS